MKISWEPWWIFPYFTAWNPPTSRCVAHGDTTEVVPRLLGVSMTEEEVQGLIISSLPRDQGTPGDPKGCPTGVGFPQETWWDDPGFLQLRQQPGNRGPVTTGCDKDDTGRLETNQTTKIIKNMSLGWSSGEPCEIIAIRKALEGQWSSKSVALHNQSGNIGQPEQLYADWCWMKTTLDNGMCENTANFILNFHVTKGFLWWETRTAITRSASSCTSWWTPGAWHGPGHSICGAPGGLSAYPLW